MAIPLGTTGRSAAGKSMTSLTANMARGAAWNVLLRVMDRLVGLVSTLVLARLLVPADFGLVALAVTLIELLALMGAWGLELALIQNARADRRHFDTVWTFNVLFGMGLAVLLILLAQPVALFYSEPRLVLVIMGLALSRAVAGFQNVGVILFQRDMDFDRDFRFRLYKRLASTFAVTLPLALLLRNHWALVGGTLASSCLGVLLSYRMHPYRPRFSWVAWRELFGVSKWLQLVLLVRVVSERCNDFVIARFAGLAALGSFTLAREIAQLPSAELTMAIHGGVFPGYTRMAHDVGLLKQAYLRVTALLNLATLPAGIGLALLAQPVVVVFLGDQWLSVVPLLQVLAVNFVISVTSRSASYVYLALGVSQYSATLALLRALVSLGAMLLLVPSWGVLGAALAVLLATMVAAPLNLWLLSRALRLRPGEVAAVSWRPALATLATAGVLAWLPGLWAAPKGWLGQVLVLLSGLAAGGLTYLTALALLWQLAARPQGAETWAMATIASSLSKIGRRVQAWQAR